MNQISRRDAVLRALSLVWLGGIGLVHADAPQPDQTSTACTVHVTTASYAWKDDARPYRLAQGRCTPATAPERLVVALHAGGSDARAMADYTGLDALADDGRTVVAYPQGDRRVSGLLTWNAGHCCGNAMLRNVDDVSYVRGLIALLRARFGLPAGAVYLAGLSNGAMLAYRLAASAPQEVAGVIAVAGTAATTPLPAGARLRILHVHGDDDQHVPWLGGTGQRTLSGTEHASVRDTLQPWVQVTQATQPVEIVRLAALDDARTRVTSYRYRDAAGVVRVELIGIAGGGHTWPGSSRFTGWLGEANRTMNMNRVMREFMADASEMRP